MGQSEKKWNPRPMARLYHIAMSPYCRKVRLILAEKRIECELIEERYWERDPSFLRRNPAAKVPVLEIDGKIMSESAAICEYLEEKYPNPALMPVDIHQRYEVRRLVGWFDDKFHRDVTSKLVYERVTKKIMGQGYPDSKNVKAGDMMSLADFAAAAHLSALDYISDVDWHRNKALKDWYAKIKSRPAFRSILADQVPGFPQPSHYADLDF